MKFLLVLLCAALASCQSGKIYQPKSVAEARAYAKSAVEMGAIHKGGEEALILRKSSGKPLEGKWDQRKMEKYVARFVSENPRLAEINLSSTKGVISDRERLILIAQLEAAQAAEAERRAARSQAMAAALNNMSASLNQTTANINRGTALINQSTVNSLNSGAYTPSYSSPLYHTPSYSAPVRITPSTVPLYRY